MTASWLVLRAAVMTWGKVLLWGGGDENGVVVVCENRMINIG